MEHAASLQEIKEVESDMYLSERQLKDKLESLQNSQQSMGSQEGFLCKSHKEEALHSPKTLVTRSQKLSLKDQLIRQEIEK